MAKHQWFNFKDDDFRCCELCCVIENPKITDGECGGSVPVELRKENKNRSLAQNRSLHKMYGQISDYCTEQGIDQKTVVDKLEAYSCPTSPQFVKETWRAMQIAITGKESTTYLTTDEVQQVYDVFNKFWSEITGNHFPFPSHVADYDEEFLRRNGILD